MALTDATLAANNAASTTTLPITLGSAIAAGSFVLLAVSANGAAITCTAADNSSQAGSANTYTQRSTSTYTSNTITSYVLACKVTRAMLAGDVITVTFSSARTNSAVQGGVFDDGVSTTLDGTAATALGASAAPSAGPTGDPATTRALVILAGGARGSALSFAGASGLTTGGYQSSGTSTTNRAAFFGYKYDNSPPGAQTPAGTLGVSDNWTCSALCFDAASTATNASAENALAALAANDATVQLLVNAEGVTAGAAAQDPGPKVAPNAEGVAVSALAQDATTSALVNAESATAVAGSLDPSVALLVSAAPATAAATANDATVSTAVTTSAPAEAAGATLTAQDPQVALRANAEANAATAAALDAAGGISAAAESAAVAAAAQSPLAAVSVNAESAGATATALDATVTAVAGSVNVAAEVATAVATAYDATVVTTVVTTPGQMFGRTRTSARMTARPHSTAVMHGAPDPGYVPFGYGELGYGEQGYGGDTIKGAMTARPKATAGMNQRTRRVPAMVGRSTASGG